MKKIKNIISLSILGLAIAVTSHAVGDDSDLDSPFDSPVGQRLFAEAKEDFSFKACMRYFNLSELEDPDNTLWLLIYKLKEKKAELTRSSDNIEKQATEVAMKAEVIFKEYLRIIMHSELPTKE